MRTSRTSRSTAASRRCCRRSGAPAAARAVVSAQRGPRGGGELPALVDSPCHPAEPDFGAERDGVLQRAVAGGVRGLVCIGAAGAVESNFPAVALAGRPAPLSI